MTPELEQAVADASSVFARYSLGGSIIVCRCPSCVSPEIERALIETPLHAISRELLAEYTNSAHGWDVRISQDFRYFLPRYFELIASGEAPSQLDLEPCLDRMFHANYRQQWPPAEADAVDGFFVALFRGELNQPVLAGRFGLFDAGKGAEAILCCFAHAGGDVRRLLDVWDSTAGRAADLRIAATIAAADWRNRQLSNIGWLIPERRPIEQAMDVVIAWLARTETWERLETACIAETDAMAADLLSQAEGMIARNA